MQQGIVLIGSVWRADSLGIIFKDVPYNMESMEATFGAGCFWHVEEIFGKIPGVVSTSAGYAGGSTADPTYEQVCGGRTGHAESVRVEYDPEKTSYEKLLRVFWENHDPTTPNRQGPDIGEQYRSVVFTHSKEQEESAKSVRDEISKAGGYSAPIVTQIVPAGEFYRAEEYHQKYFKKNGMA